MAGILEQAIIEKDPELGHGKIKQWLIDLKTMKNFYLALLDIVVPDDDTSISYNTKFYPFLLYVVIKNCQQQAILLLNDLYSNELLAWLKNTRLDYSEHLDWVRNQTFDCYTRFIIYESIFKTLFNIKIEENNLNVISVQIPIFSNLNENQIKTLKEYIVDPIFHGVYKNIFNDEYKVLNCASTETNCKIQAAKFPYPISNDSPKPPLQGLPDSLKIMSLYNSVASSKQVAANLITATYSGIDAIMYGLTGIQKGYTLKLEEWTEKKAENLLNIPSDINKELKKLKNSISGALSAVGSTNITESLKPFVILGSVALGLFFADKVLPE